MNSGSFRDGNVVTIAMPPELTAVVERVGQAEVERVSRELVDVIRDVAEGDVKLAALYAVTAYAMLCFEAGL